MGKNFGQMKTNVGNMVRDTSSTFAVIIGQYINDRYHECLKAANWDSVDDDYTISVTAGTQSYSLPSNFGKEVACNDDTNDIQLSKTTFQSLYKDYPGETTTTGTVNKYCIFTNDSGTKKILFHFNPTQDITVSLPYLVNPTDLSADADEPIADLSDVIEQGAIADAWKYKKQGSKAQVAEGKYKERMNLWIWNDANQANGTPQFNISSYSRETV